MDSDDSENSSAPSSPSPPASPAASFHAAPSVERLVQHFVSAKRSLGSTNYVWRANELVTSSRALIEEIATLNAKNKFTRRGVDDEAEILHRIRDGIVNAGDQAGQEFASTIERLDEANDRLQRTLEQLRETTVDTSLQSTLSAHRDDDTAEEQDAASEVASPGSETEQEDEEKTLYDFIDSTSHTTLQTSLRELIDKFNDSRSDLDSTLATFADSLATVASLLREKDSPDPVDRGTIYDEPAPTIPHLFHGMEEHAAEMATLLQSLVSHYDLCVSALKHTEGGGEAAKKALQAEDLSTKNGNTEAGVEESLYLKTAPEPISDAERTEMLRVLENDAQEVEDVVGEIRDRNRDQESLFEQLSSHAKDAKRGNQALRNVLEILHEMQDIHLPAHLHALLSFRAEWQRIKATIESQTGQLAGLSEFYAGFLSGYAKLLREVDRRRAAEQQLRRVAEKANKEMLKLYEADSKARADFMEDVGRFLPQGLWPGAMDDGIRWEVREVE